VFWVHAGTRARFEEGYRRIAEATKMDGWDDPKADVLRLVRSWLCDESNGRWMMVVDNADDSDVLFPSLDRTESLSDFLPQSPNGSILVTSRNRDVAYRLTGSNKLIVDVEPMDKKEALTLVQKKVDFSVEEDDAVELVESLDCMPLAITQAAAFIHQRAPRMTVSRYVEEVRRSDHDRARLLQRDVGDSRRDGRASNSILATWQISFEHIRATMPTAARLLSLMSLFDRQGIPEQPLHDRYVEEDGQTDFDDDIYTLRSYSLVGVSVDGHSFEMHRLVQFLIKKWLELYGELEAWKERYVRLMDDSLPVGRHENWKACQALFPHAQAAVECRLGQAEALKAWASVLFKAAWYASEMGQHEVAKDMDCKALETREVVLGMEHPDTLASVSNLAVVLWRQGKYEAAEAMNRRALEGREKALGKDHPDTLTSVYCLAYLLHHRHRYKEALPLYQRASSSYLVTLRPDHPTTLACLDHQSSLQQVLDQEASGNRRYASTDGSISITPSASRRLASSTSQVELTLKDH
jgi:hypothetical protein